MKRLVLVIAFLSACLAACTASAAEIGVVSTIDRVTVYRDRAEVTRVGTVQLVAGTHELLFNGLPAAVDADSLHISGKGTAAVTISGVEARRTYHAEEQVQRIRELEEQLETLNDEVNHIEGALHIIEGQREFLRAIHVPSLSDLPKESEVPKPSLANWQSILDLRATKLGELNAQQLDHERQKRELQQQIEALNNELNKLRGGPGRSTISAVVDLDVEKGGSQILELTYIVRPAGWLPLYDVRLDAEAKKVALTYLGTVVQKTGEDWANVRLTLSTAQPQIGASAPELRPIHLAAYEARPKAPQAAPQPTMALEGRDAGGRVPYALSDERRVQYLDAEYAAAPEQATVQIVGPLVLFEVPGREDVPSDGNPHRATVTTESFEAELEHVALPKLVPHTFLKAKLTNDSENPLLAGKANVFVDGNFVGAGVLDSVAAGEEFELGFGADESVKVERTELKDLTGKSGIFNNRRSIARGYRIEVANYRDEDVQLTLLDQIPVPQDEEIKVTLGQLNLQPTEKTEQGIISWEVKLPPREKKEVRFEYLVEYPENRQLVGLD
jgi:uncharacterized protein (TIGR02231 family)